MATAFITSSADFNPRTPCGVRHPWDCDRGQKQNFNPRTPCGVRHVMSSSQASIAHFNPRTPCGVRRLLPGIRGIRLRISIHAPLAGCDNVCSYNCNRRDIFQSTHPLRGATGPASRRPWSDSDFNPRTPCGVRRENIPYSKFTVKISIHAPLAGCDAVGDPQEPGALISIHAPLAGCDDLQPGSAAIRYPISIHAPLAGCDLVGVGLLVGREISIHAPLAGCDQSNAPLHITSARNFNPRTPCGVRLAQQQKLDNQTVDFNPRTPCGVRRAGHVVRTASRHFNPRTPCGVRRRYAEPQGDCPRDFNPRTPCGVRRGPFGLLVVVHGISIHAPLAGCDYRYPQWSRGLESFQSTHPLRGATAKTYKENCTFFELADKLSARIAAKKPSAKADRCA